MDGIHNLHKVLLDYSNGFDVDNDPNVELDPVYLGDMDDINDISDVYVKGNSITFNGMVHVFDIEDRYPIDNPNKADNKIDNVEDEDDVFSNVVPDGFQHRSNVDVVEQLGRIVYLDRIETLI